MHSPRLVDVLAALDEETRREVIGRMSRKELRRYRYGWRGVWARPDQHYDPGRFRHTAFIAGRGWGKTRTGAEATRERAYQAWQSGGRRRRNKADKTWGRGARLGLAGRTANDVNETLLYDTSGLMNISPPWFMPVHHASKMKLEWPNGAIARLMKGDVAKSFRGPNIGFLWADELVHWLYAEESWATANDTLRHGEQARSLITSTPLGTEFMIKLLFELDDNGEPIPAAEDERSFQGYRVRADTKVVRGSTFDNLQNLNADYIDTLGASTETERGRQEIHGEIILEIKGAPFASKWFRRCDRGEVPELHEIVVAVDPAGTKKKESQKKLKPETGIIVLGIDRTVDHLYLLEDASGNYSATEWGKKAVELANFWEADRIVCEDNNGGEMVESTIRLANIDEPSPVKVHRVHASKSKFERAKMVSVMWESGRVYHVGDSRRFSGVEFQMTHYDPTKADNKQQSDRMDAIVWGALALVGDGSDRTPIRARVSRSTWAAVGDHLRGQIKHGRGTKLHVGENVITLHAWQQHEIDALAELVRAA